MQVEAACEVHRSFDLVIIGYALPKEEKRRVMVTLRKHCGQTPILELYPHGTTPVDEEADEQLPSADEPDALLAKLREALARDGKSVGRHRDFY